MVSSVTPIKPDSRDTLEKFKRIPLFKSLGDEALLRIQSYFYETSFSKETVIFYEQDLPSKTGSRIYFVLDGCIKLVKYSSDGESTIVRLASTGEFFGVTGALTNQSNPFSAEALADTTVLYLNKDNFKILVGQYPDLALNMICAMGEVLWFNYATHNQVVKKSEARVAKIILYHLKRDGYQETPEGLQLKINLPHDYIASMTGIAYEESVRIVSRLKKQSQCIKYLRGGKILITNLPALREVAQENESCGF
jgi:CRP-like cAMP-binding protein